MPMNKIEDKADDTKTDSQGMSVAAPSLSLPKGGGAIRGIGEKFAANPVTGTGAMTVPIATSQGRSGFGPQLALSHDSGAGNGPFGLGWNLSLPAITRKTDKGLPKYQDAEESDVFILSGAEDLVPVFKQDAQGNWVRDAQGKMVFHEEDRDVGTFTYRVRRYRPRIEGLFARIERWVNLSDPHDTFWRSISKDNITTFYGKTAESRIADPTDPARIFTWLICQSNDDKGNVIIYGYKPEDSTGIDFAQAHERNRTDQTRSGNRYIKRIRYGNRTPFFPNFEAQAAPTPLPTDWMFEVIFDYSEHDTDAPAPHDAGAWECRNDPFSSYRAGFEVRTYRLCQRVLTFHHFPNEPGVGADCLVRSTDFTYSYEENPADARNPIFSFLMSVGQSGYKPQPSAGYLKKSLPPLAFTYTEATIQEEVHAVDSGSLENLPYGLDGAHYQWVDLDGEGLSGTLTEQADGWFYKRNLSPINAIKINGSERIEALLAPMELVAAKPAASLAGHAQFLDLAGDGQLDLVTFREPIPGFYERTLEAGGWKPFIPFTSLPALDWDDPNLKFVDLTGDGHPDILITEDEVFWWHPSLAEEGFGPAETTRQSRDEETGPQLVFADGADSIYLADLSGDGLTDLVRIRNGEVCYWPNLGYGRFGAKVMMDNSPRFDSHDLFDQQRIRLADIDGSGTTDLIYLGANQIDIYLNKSGNRWGNAQPLTTFPRIDNLSVVQAVDLLGNGTACLVWSSPLPGDARRPMRYIDLMGRQKPHLLLKTVNNLGAETVVSYAPSTKFYLQDKLAGKPWITNLPFPVHVVERVETHDRISGNRFVTRYAYHHGYFDGVEREFRGFGMVEQFDTEEFAALKASQQFPVGTNVEESSHVPPVLTRTWFHNGVYLGRDHVSDFFAGLVDGKDVGEYYREPGLTDAQARQLLLDDTILPTGLTDEEEREACRAMKGSMLRQEVYALDAPGKPKHPYTVTEQNLTIELIQGRVDNRHAVFFVHPREVISYHYERQPADPRIAHALTLEVDEFGNVLKSAAVGYGRRQSDPDLEPRDQAKQSELLITYTENGVTNRVEADNDYRTPLPCEARTYELTGLTLPAGRSRSTLVEMLTAGTGAAPIAYEQSPTQGVLQKRLIEHVRTLYRPDDLGVAQNDPLALLPLRTVEPLALPGESYKLAFTPGLLTGVYGGRVSDSMLATEGRYVHSEGDGNWWIPSGRIFFSTGSADAAAEELAYARQHFFLPHRYRDPFHTNAVSTESFVSYDAYDLLMVQTRDALGNVVTVATKDDTGSTAIRIDYRVLQPYWVTDPNDNRSRVALDTLGMVVGTAVMGKPIPAPVEGDALDGFDTDLTEAVILDHLANPLVGPQAILTRATTRLVYDLFAYQRTKDLPNPQPAVVYTLVRETHDSDPVSASGLKIQHSLSYSDGFGREIQKKIQAEPGTVPKRDANGKIIVGPDGQPEMTLNDVSPRWVGSGWTVFNNKGKPVRQYEPFFTDTHRSEFDVRIGVSPVLFYDPVERVVATLHPNHTWEKVVFDPWRQEAWDVSDTVLAADPKIDPDVGDFFRRLPDADYLPTWYAQRQGGALGPQEQDAARKTALHAETPSVAHADSLGRTFLTVAHNKFKYSETPAADPPTEEFHRARVIYDIEGNQRAVRDAIVQNGDAQGRIVMRYDYDMLGNRIHQARMEAGERWMLGDVAGKPIYAWDSRGHQFRTTYDQLRRPTDSFLGEGAGPELLIGRAVYGEIRPNPETKNLRGKVVQLFDQAGVVTSEDYDFKGNLLSSSRELAQEYKNTINWAVTHPSGEKFSSSTIYDALNRPTELTAPHTPAMQPSVYRPAYNEANLLEKVDVNLRGAAVATPFVTDIDYNAKGQRVLIEYGNQVKTDYEYDTLTFRLTHLKTTRLTDQARLQDLNYSYDPAGNITQIEDGAQQTIYFNNQVVTPSNDYVYDAIYRLIIAEGREHIGQAAQPQTTSDDQFRAHLPQPGDGQAMRRYSEEYHYDEVGNFLQLIHQAANGNWTRAYAYKEPSLLEPSKSSNRLSNTTVGGDNPELYAYDAHGNMTAMPHLTLMQWDFKDQLQATARQVVNDGTPETTYCVYDAAGQRVRKVTERQNGTRKNERIYLGGFEVFRKYDGNGTSVSLERETLHVMDDKQRIALVETRTQGDDHSPGQLIRYQFGNHLGSASLELDAAGQMISCEEYYAYGSTSYQAVRSQTETPKRYRYTGMERDEETGFSYHSARFYASWLGRWTSPDRPAISEDGTNPYGYARNNPVNRVDQSGFESREIHVRISISDQANVSLPKALKDFFTKSIQRYFDPLKTAPGSDTAVSVDVKFGQFTDKDLKKEGNIQVTILPGWDDNALDRGLDNALRGYPESKLKESKDELKDQKGIGRSNPFKDKGDEKPQDRITRRILLKIPRIFREAVLEFNRGNKKSAFEFLKRWAISTAHEIGHNLGLEHNQTADNSIPPNIMDKKIPQPFWKDFWSQDDWSAKPQSAQQKEAQREQRRKEALENIAPGWEISASDFKAFVGSPVVLNGAALLGGWGLSGTRFNFNEEGSVFYWPDESKFNFTEDQIKQMRQFASAAFTK
jgi:RHS repeat-associated protein